MCLVQTGPALVLDVSIETWLIDEADEVGAVEVGAVVPNFLEIRAERWVCADPIDEGAAGSSGAIIGRAVTRSHGFFLVSRGAWIWADTRPTDTRPALARPENGSWVAVFGALAVAPWYLIEEAYEGSSATTDGHYRFPDSTSWRITRLGERSEEFTLAVTLEQVDAPPPSRS